MTADQLRKLDGLSAFDALRTLQGYQQRTSQVPTSGYTLILDRVYAVDFEVLNAIPATEIEEIRIIPAAQASRSFGTAEVIVTTVGGRRRTQ
jgi:hypothetical protein